MKVAIFSDLHGRLLLAFKLAERYQRETGQNIDLILQCGDAGIFPELEHLDDATLRFAKKDRSELGFHDYFVTPHPKVEAALANLNCDMMCVRETMKTMSFWMGLKLYMPVNHVFR